MIQRRRHEMYRTAVDAHSFLQRPLVRVQTGKGRQQRGMDIHQAPFVVAHEAFAEDAHEAGQHDKIGRKTINARRQRRIKSLAPGKSLVVEMAGGNTCLCCRCQSGSIRPVADHGSDIDG